jgi:hypothetical protein
MEPLTGNDKRKATCKQVGGAKKRAGHAKEHLFNAAFGVPAPITYKAEADASFTTENPNTTTLLDTLRATFGPAAEGGTACSIKSGTCLQFTLGRIDEITAAATPEAKLAALGERSLWEKYLGKSKSGAPAYWLVYYNSDGSWQFFLMADIIDYVVANCKWRALETGRLKGDLEGRQYLTYEYRDTHGSHFLGANGGRGGPWIELLTRKIRTCRVAVPAPSA